MLSAGEEGAAPAMVKVIVTRFVETDAVQFKSVVQSLTGKDSTVADNGWDAPLVEAGGASAAGIFAEAAVSTMMKDRGCAHKPTI
ncbi:hypothetical protein KFK09_026275 [Dendrobium nobile]|uniref:VQ domain-containing protein n=1 Tax=Dendrobium nobile TaxID=94219 RepID=A0A8T3A731_DENNO|nr:hypothetical protein KFK09_026275 [Dendrobium nobile]